ncbi:hypothetical protein M434DRAFT_300341 [Hypoxylon sp. CO27-5]|nr:hypothetical protein M434DRAFT_300341 [Hypoxylon sp. CO27-5]
MVWTMQRKWVWGRMGGTYNPVSLRPGGRVAGRYSRRIKFQSDQSRRRVDGLCWYSKRTLPPPTCFFLCLTGYMYLRIWAVWSLCGKALVVHKLLTKEILDKTSDSRSMNLPNC